MLEYNIKCPKCNSVLGSSEIEGNAWFHCPVCNSLLQIGTYPALLAPKPKGQLGEDILTDEESACFYHPDKRAVTVCEHCGRFLCALCDIEMADHHLCALCIEAGASRETLDFLVSKRILYDNVALSLALWPLLLVFMTILTAPAAIYISLRYWNAPTSIVGRGKQRFIGAIFLSLLEIAGWILIPYLL